MRVLIVEDNNAKAGAIVAAVEAAGILRDDLRIVPDAVNAREVLAGEPFDVLLLDLQIPNRFSEPANRSGGAELVHWLFRRPAERMPPHIVAVTGFDLTDETERTLLGHGIPVVRAKASGEDWKAFITGLVKRVAYSVKPSGAVARQQVGAIILTAADVELEQVRRVFGGNDAGELRGEVNWHRAELPTARGTRSVMMAQTVQMGMPAAAVLTMKAIGLWSPDLVIFSGICAGIPGEVDLGDLVVPDPCWDYGSGKLTADGLLKPDPRSVELRESIRALVLSAKGRAPLSTWRDEWPAEKPNSVPRLHVRPAASGAAVVADLKTAPMVQSQSRKVVGIDMENYGFYFACANSGSPSPPAFCAVKAVVDFADPEKGDKYQAYGAYMSARFSRWIVEQAELRG